MMDTPKESFNASKVTIDWYRSTPWWRLASQTIAISWRSSHLALCALGLMLTYGWTNLCHLLFDHTKLGQATWVTPNHRESILNSGLSLQGSPDSFFEVWARYLSVPFGWLQDPTVNGAADALSSMIGIIAIWSFVAGCISRRAVMELGANITSPWEDCIRLVLKRWQSIAWSTTMPIALILLISIVPLMLGWLSNLPWVGGWIAGLLLIPIVVSSIGIGWCAAITMLAFPLSVCAVVAEKQADAFDGISRSAAYSFQRPLTLALSALAAQLVGMIGGSILSLVLSTGFAIVRVAFETGSASELETLNPMWSGILNGFVPLLILSYSFSLFWTASSAIYLVLRKDVDHAEFDVLDMAATADPKPLPELITKSSMAMETTAIEVPAAITSDSDQSVESSKTSTE